MIEFIIKQFEQFDIFQIFFDEINFLKNKYVIKKIKFKKSCQK